MMSDSGDARADVGDEPPATEDATATDVVTPPGPRSITSGVLGTAIALGFAVLIAIRLGTTLIGQRVFLGLNLFRVYAPWSATSDPGLAGSSRYVQDQIDFFIPGLHEVASRLTNGDIAAWSPYVGGGSSLLGTPVFGLISATRWVYFFLPTWLAPGWSKLIEIAVAALFTYLLVRRLNGSKLAAGLAGFIYPTTGFMIAWTNWPQAGVGAVIPVLFWSIERFIQERRIRAAVPIAVATALLLFGGFPAVAGLSLYFAGGYAVVRVLATSRRSVLQILRRLGVIAAAVLAGVGLTAVQLLPFVYQFLQTVDLTYREQGFFRAEPLRFVPSMIFPQSYGANELSVYKPPFNPVEVNTYLGSVVLLLAALGILELARRRSDKSAGLYLLAVAALAVALIWLQGPWSAWMNGLPVFSGNPIGRIRSQLGVPVAVLAAFGFDRLLSVRSSPNRSESQSAWSWPVALIGMAGATLVGVAAYYLTHGWPKGLSRHTTVDALTSALPLGVVALGLLVGWRVKAARVPTLLVIIAAVVVQAIGATGYYWPTGDRADFYRTTAAHDFLQDNLGTDRIVTAGSPLLPNTTSFYDIRTLTGHGFFPKPMKDVLQAISPVVFPVPTYSAFGVGIADVITSPGLDRMGVRYLIGDSNVQVLGTPGPIAAVTGEVPITVVSALTATIVGGPMRAVQIPLSKVQRATDVRVQIMNGAGTVIATNSQPVAPGAAWAIVPVALDPADPGVVDGTYTVAVTAGGRGVVAGADADGAIVVQPLRPPAQSDGVRLAYAGDELVIWERLGYVPRIHWAGAVQVISGASARLQAVVSEPTNPNSVILAAEPPAGFLEHKEQAKLSVLEDSGDTTRVRVVAPHAGYVVVADNVRADFDATVDGTTTQIVDADYAVGAVYVEAGTHEVVLTYAPRGRSTGLAITAASALVLIGAALPVGVWPWVRRRRVRARYSR